MLEAVKGGHVCVFGGGEESVSKLFEEEGGVVEVLVEGGWERVSVVVDGYLAIHQVSILCIL